MTLSRFAGLIHPQNSFVIRQRVQAVNLMADVIAQQPQAWGVHADADKRWKLAARLLELRNRVRGCQIAEAREVAAL